MFVQLDQRGFGTKEKALKINMNKSIYGTFAEIGAGQEVAAEFFKAGRSSGTVAKTMSAYDMSFSNAIYGPTTKYVSRERLDHMIEKEYSLLTRRLNFRNKKTTFFSFANTVRTGSEEAFGEGWVGVRFQLHPSAEPNHCIIHVVLRDNELLRQQQVVGTVGVNLLFGCYFYYLDPDMFIQSLLDNIEQSRIEIDMFELAGPDFKYIDNRLMSLKLVKHGLTRASIFGPKGNILQPSEVLYKRDVLVLRGRFRPMTLVNTNMLEAGLEEFKKRPNIDPDNVVTLSEITLRDLQETSNESDIDEQDFMDRVNILCSLGQTVLISNYLKYYKLCEYLSTKIKTSSLGIILGHNNLIRIFDKKYYENLRGGVLEAMALLFGCKTTLYVYPCMGENKTLLNCDDITFDTEQLLYEYLHTTGRICDITNVNGELLNIISDDVLKMLQENQKDWEKYVPKQVAETIKAQGLFNYPLPEVSEDSSNIHA